ncbi:putative envelope protein ODV-E66-22 [Microplitis demolitor]|uniref:Envelope protein ODV-E66-22 n=1 Tax=Microplitis demolitor TaxID=69319 RepID=UPI0006D4C978|nr:uncharacterized LOC103574364 [Microplitis demolitor]KAG6558318.1 putative envelope protein ODV-E66-22 [Microplitis demolitor]
MSKKKLFLIVAIITILVITIIVATLVIFLYRTTIASQFKKSNQIESKVTKIKSLMSKLESSTLSNDDAEKVKKYKDNYDNYLVESGLDWGNDSDKFVLLCDFATRMVTFYKNNINGKIESKIYLFIAIDIIQKINDRVFE